MVLRRVTGAKAPHPLDGTAKQRVNPVPKAGVNGGYDLPLPSRPCSTAAATA